MKTIKVAGKEYKITVFRIETFNEDGSPDNCTVIPDETQVTLSRDVTMNQFMVCLVPLNMFTKSSDDND